MIAKDIIEKSTLIIKSLQVNDEIKISIMESLTTVLISEDNNKPNNNNSQMQIIIKDSTQDITNVFVENPRPFIIKNLTAKGDKGEQGLSGKDGSSYNLKANSEIFTGEVELIAGNGINFNTEINPNKIIINAEVDALYDLISNLSKSISVLELYDYNFVGLTSDFDLNGIPTITEYKRKNGTLYQKIQLTNSDSDGRYQTAIVTLYEGDGITIKSTTESAIPSEVLI